LEGYLLIQLELDRQRAAQHLAVHPIIWTARAGWGSAERTRALTRGAYTGVRIIQEIVIVQVGKDNTIRRSRNKETEGGDR